VRGLASAGSMRAEVQAAGLGAAPGQPGQRSRPAAACASCSSCSSSSGSPTRIGLRSNARAVAVVDARLHDPEARNATRHHHTSPDARWFGSCSRSPALGRRPEGEPPRERRCRPRAAHRDRTRLDCYHDRPGGGDAVHLSDVEYDERPRVFDAHVTRHSHSPWVTRCMTANVDETLRAAVPPAMVRVLQMRGQQQGSRCYRGCSAGGVSLRRRVRQLRRPAPHMRMMPWGR